MVFGDSCIVIGEARNLVRNRKSPITKTHQLLKSVANEYKDVNFLHILRENNTYADRMANQGVDLECDNLLCVQQDLERNLDSFIAKASSLYLNALFLYPSTWVVYKVFQLS